MFISSYVASDRHREMLANAEQQRLARQLRTQARASRPASRAAQRLRRSLRIATARGQAPAASTHRTGAPVVVPHATPGPFRN